MLCAGLTRLLIIEDDPDVSDLLVSMLRRQGFCVSAAADGLSALELIKERSFDLLITDIRLPPPIDGLETVRLARERRPGLKSLFISGSGYYWGDPKRDDFVSKPFRGQEIVGCVWELLCRDSRRANDCG